MIYLNHGATFILDDLVSYDNKYYFFNNKKIIQYSYTAHGVLQHSTAVLQYSAVPGEILRYACGNKLSCYAPNKIFQFFYFNSFGVKKISKFSFRSGERELSKNSAAINKDLSVFPSLCIVCISQYCSRYKMFRIKLGRGIKVLQA